MFERVRGPLLGLALLIAICQFPEPMLAVVRQALEAMVIIKLLIELFKR